MGWLAILVLSGISFGVTLFLVFKHHLGIYVFDNHYTEYSYYIYSRSYTRAPAYFVGMAAAWLIHELDLRGFTRETRSFTRRAKAFATIIACCACALLVGLVFLPVTDYGSRKNSWDHWPIASAMFITFSRPLWSIGCAAFMLLCYYRYLPTMDSFLAHPFWTPLARLTYGAYLMHPSLNRLHGARALQFLTFSFMGVMSRFSFNCVMGFGASVGLWVLAERPCLALLSPSQENRAQKEEQNQLPSGDELSRCTNSSQPLVPVEKFAVPPAGSYPERLLQH